MSGSTGHSSGDLQAVSRGNKYYLQRFQKEAMTQRYAGNPRKYSGEVKELLGPHVQLMEGPRVKGSNKVLLGREALGQRDGTAGRELASNTKD